MHYDVCSIYHAVSFYLCNTVEDAPQAKIPWSGPTGWWLSTCTCKPGALNLRSGEPRRGGKSKKNAPQVKKTRGGCAPGPRTGQLRGLSPTRFPLQVRRRLKKTRAASGWPRCPCCRAARRSSLGKWPAPLPCQCAHADGMGPFYGWAHRMYSLLGRSRAHTQNSEPKRTRGHTRTSAAGCGGSGKSCNVAMPHKCNKLTNNQIGFLLATKAFLGLPSSWASSRVAS